MHGEYWRKKAPILSLHKFAKHRLPCALVGNLATLLAVVPGKQEDEKPLQVTI